MRLTISISILFSFAATTLHADTVTLTNGAIIEGRVTERPGGDLHVAIGEVGALILSAETVEGWQRDDATGAPAPASAPQPGAPTQATAEGTTIATTHRLTMVRGRTLRANLVSEIDATDAAPARLELNIEGYGNFIIERDQVEEITRESGEIRIPPRFVAPPTPVVVEPEPTFEEIVAEIAAEVVARLYDQKPAAVSDLDAETLAHAVSELGRQRSKNRVRAENQLRSYGPVALPFLDSAIAHPLNLTRRAAMRLVRDAAVFEGVPLAIAGLADPDPYVREFAQAAIDAGLRPAIEEGVILLRGRWTEDTAWRAWLSEESRRLERLLGETILEAFPPAPIEGGAGTAP